jgi:hypothetical protein
MSPKKLWVQPDNTRLHNAKVSTDFIALNRMKQTLHPPYSPDLAASDFFFLATSKES